MKNQRRGRPDPGEFDRPRAPYGEGNNRMPFGRSPHHHRGNSEGLSFHYLERLFDYERDHLWPSRGFISPYKDYPGRTARRRREFELWLHWHPVRDYVELRMFYDYERGYGWPYGYNLNSHHRSSPRQSRSIDIRDPRSRPPYITDRSVYGPPDPIERSAYIQKLTGDIPREARRDCMGRVHERHSHTQRPHGAGGRNHPQHPFYEPPRDRSRYPPPRRHHEHRDRSTSRRRHPRTNPDYDPHFSNGYHPYKHPRTHHHPPHEYEDEDEDDFSDDLSSQSSNESYIRTPRHNRRSRPRRHETYTDDEDGDGYFNHRGRGGSRRDSGRSRRGSRHYDGEHVDYDFSGDEDGRYGF